MSPTSPQRLLPTPTIGPSNAAVKPTLHASPAVVGSSKESKEYCICGSRTRTAWDADHPLTRVHGHHTRTRERHYQLRSPHLGEGRALSRLLASLSHMRVVPTFAWYPLLHTQGGRAGSRKSSYARGSCMNQPRRRSIDMRFAKDKETPRGVAPGPPPCVLPVRSHPGSTLEDSLALGSRPHPAAILSCPSLHDHWLRHLI